MYEDEDNTSAGSNTDTEAYREQLQKSTAELSNLAEQSGERYNVQMDRTKDGQIRGARIQTTQNEEGPKGHTTTFVEKKYTFASNATTSGKMAPNPNYTEKTSIIKDGKKTWQRTETEIEEHESFRTPGEMVRFESTSNEAAKTKGDKHYYSSTRSHVSIGDRKDELETSKNKVYVEGYNLRDIGYNINAGVGVKADLKDKEFHSFQGYERQKDANGNLKYKLKQESYFVQDKKTKISTIYKEDGHGNLDVKKYDAQDVEMESGPVTKQMKKDHKKYKKLNEKLVKQASKAKTSQAYMEATPMYTESKVTKANMSEKSLENVTKAQNDVKAIIAKKSKDKIR